MVKTKSRTLLTAVLAALTIAIISASAFSIAATQTSAQTNQEMTQGDMTAMMQQDQASETPASTNATDMMGGMSMLNIDTMSMVDGVKVTGVNVESNNEISVNLKYTGNGSSPRITAVVMGVTTTGMMNMMSHGQMMMGDAMGMNMAHENEQNSMSGGGNMSNGMSPMISMNNSMLSGSNVLEPGWESPSTLTIELQGNTTTDDIAYIMVMIFPFSE